MSEAENTQQPEQVEQSQPEQVSTPKVEVAHVKQAGLTFEQRIEELKKTGSQSQKTLIAELEQYVQAMKPGMPVEPVKGAARQYGLWLTLNKTLTSFDRKEFKSLWSIVLMFFQNYKDGVFGERFVFRFAEYWIQGPTELTALQRLLNLIMLTRDQSQQAKGLKQVNLNTTLAEGFTEEAKSRILAYYNK